MTDQYNQESFNPVFGSKPVTGRPKQMEKQPNQLLWNLVFVGIVFLTGLGIYKSSQSIDYIWRWERIPQYLFYQAQEDYIAEFDGVVSLGENGVVELVSDNDPDTVQTVMQPQLLLADDGDLVFEGDSFAAITYWEAGPLVDGMVMTLQLSLVSIVLAIIIGTVAGLFRISNNPALKKLAILYIELVRGTPLLVQIFLVYFFLGSVLDMERFTAGVIALSVFTGAYIAEIVRAGIESISRGQMEAARSLGMGWHQAMRYVILPQAFKRVLPPLAGQFINLIKDSSLVSVISITDLTKAGREVVSSTFSPFEVWFSVALCYLILTGVLSLLVRKLEVRYAVSD